MAYRIDPTASTGDEVRRVAHERIDDAMARLDGLVDAPPNEIEKSVHEVRKRCKELRGLARLVRPALGADFARFNRTVRDAAMELSSIRDAHAVLATLDDLQAAAGNGADHGVERVRAVKAAAASEATRSLSTDDARLRRARKLLKRARKDVDRWKIADGFDDLEGGLERTFRRGRRDLRAVRKHPTDESVHEWRKAVKNLWYEVRLLTAAAPSVLEPMVARLDDLADALGDDHDLTVLVERLDAEPDLDREDTRITIEMARQQQQELRAGAFRLGATLYSEHPTAFIDRVRSYWKMARTRGPELPTGSIANLTTSRRATDPVATVELTRTFLVTAPPPVEGKGSERRQGYVAIDRSVSVRIRDTNGEGQTMIFNAGSGPVGTELEWSIPRSEFDELWELTDGRRIFTTRHRVPIGDHQADVDVFGDDLTRLVLAEVEFEDEDALTAFEPPAWFGPEVTDDPRYSVASLALRDGS